MEVPIENANVINFALGDFISRYLIELIEAYGMPTGSKEKALINKDMLVEITERVEWLKILQKILIKWSYEVNNQSIFKAKG